MWITFLIIPEFLNFLIENDDFTKNILKFFSDVITDNNYGHSKIIYIPNIYK